MNVKLGYIFWKISCRGKDLFKQQINGLEWLGQEDLYLQKRIGIFSWIALEDKWNKDIKQIILFHFSVLNCLFYSYDLTYVNI